MRKDIEGFEGLYQACDSGRIWSCVSGKYLDPKPSKDGYLRVSLYKNGKRYRYQVHRIIALYFCQGYAEGKVVDHIDGDKTNNEPINLRWVYQRENVQNQIYRGTLDVRTAQLVAREKNKKPIVMVHPNGTEEEFTSTKECAEKYSLSVGKITDVLKGRRLHHKGYTFKYING